MPNYKPAFIILGEDKPCTNGQTFATEAEARSSAQSRFMHWTVPSDFTTLETDEPVNYRWDNELGDVMINQESTHA